MVSDLVAGPFGALLAVGEPATYSEAVFQRWLDWLHPYWGTAFVHHTAARSDDGDLALARARRAIERIDDERVDGSVLALLFGRYRALATLATLRCSTLTNVSATAPTKVLVALSRPDHRSETLRTAAWIAAKTNARLFGVHVAESEDEVAHPGAAIVANAKALASGVARAPIEEVFVEAASDVASVIDRWANKLDADLVVIGARRANRGPITRTIASRAAIEGRATLVVADPRSPGGAR